MTRPLPIVQGGFGGIIADPPWEYNAGKATRIKPPYPTMTVQEICDLPVYSLAARESFLFLWTTANFLEVGHQVMRAWKFEPLTQMVWVKGRAENSELVLHIGMGSTVRICHEFVLIGRRGGICAPEASRDIPSVLLAPRGQHSAKPDKLHDIVERIAPGPHLELFARKRRPGWATWGNEL